mmetsp:Transcript_17635/g.27644  ORF Transcript_17635/g.27644 Transcript_17635/m.27644 type:complete len:82 (-) Transcript_17635:219-464(-)
MSPPAAAASTARQVLQRRAIQCSFSSVFHLRNCAGAGTGEKARNAMKEAKNAERIFFRAVALPVYAMGVIGVAAYGHKQWK